jgi:sugar-specific transcriptional regulator TrmB
MQLNFLSRYDQVLRNLGLMDYEIKVYSTLLSNGPMNYRVLVQESGVPTGRIYQVLSTLESKGFIEVDQDKTKLFKATEPKKAFTRRLRQIEEDYLELENKTRQVLQELQMEYSQTYESIKGIVNEIRVGDNSFSSVVRENLLKAEEEILISPGELVNQLHIDDVIRVLLSRGVNIRALCSIGQGANAEASTGFSNTLATLGVKTRLQQFIPSKYFVVDSKSVLLFLAEPEKEACVQIQGKTLCRVLRDSFTDAWEKARILNYNSGFNPKLNAQTVKNF